MLLIGLTLASVAPAQHARAAERPNILWLSCEDISPHLGSYGDTHATTPDLDRLARQGIRYTHATVVAGVCAPSRSSIITGMYPTTLGTHPMRCDARLPEFIRPFTVYLREAGYYCANNVKKDYQFQEPPDTWDESSGQAHWRNRPRKDQPFFAVFNFTGTHESGIFDKARYEQVTAGLPRHDRDKVAATLPPYYPDTPLVREDWGRYYDVIAAMDQWAGRLLAQLDEDGLAENTIVMFWSDHGVGLPRAKRWLYDSGVRVPLIVRVPLKFRQAGQGAPGTIDDRLVSLMDLGPTVLNLAAVAPPDHLQGRAFLGPDLPLRREYLHAAADRMDERYDIIRAVRDRRFKYIRNYEPWKPWYQHVEYGEQRATMREIRRLAAEGSLAGAAALFAAPVKPAEELYDLENDPHEVRNLAGLPEHRRTLERMRAAHEAWIHDTLDLGFLPEDELLAGQERYGNRYAILRQPGGAALLRQLRAAAVLAAEDEHAIPRMIEAMRDPEPGVRTWAAIGLGNLSHAARDTKPLLLEALSDPSPSVRIAAARALGRMGETPSGLAALETELLHGRPYARVQAAYVVDNLHATARPLLDVLPRLLEVNRGPGLAPGYTRRLLNHAAGGLTRE